MLDRITTFALVVGLSSIAYAAPPRATSAERRAPARSTKASKAKPPRAISSQNDAAHHGHDDRFRDIKLKLRKRDSAQQRRVQVYVNGSGAQLRGGFEDAARGHSSIVDHAGLASLSFPAYGGGNWPALMSCVSEQFNAFDIEITDRRPASDDFIMLMVGGSPSLIGEDGSVAGVAPFMGSVVYGAVGFAFSEVHGNDVQGLCETVAHEIGHTLGLDHTYECRDTMSYLHCGPKTFVDEAMSCGEWEPRTCGGGSSWQSSHGSLMSSLGSASQHTPTPTPVAPEPVDPGSVAPEPLTPAEDPSDDGWWESAGSEEWEEWIVWDPVSGQWLSWDAAAGDWVVWTGAEEWVEWEEVEEWEEWVEVEEWVETEEWVEWVDEGEWEEWVEWEDCPGN